MEQRVSEVQLTGQLDDEKRRENNKGQDLIKIYGQDDERSITATELRWKSLYSPFFLPNDMSIIEGPASFRRRLMDMVLALIVPSLCIKVTNGL